MTGPFRSFMQAGFEPGCLPWNGMDLLQATGHTPARNMAANYASVRALGMHTVRDGLPWRHDPWPRLGAARDGGIQAIWDLCHFDPPLHPIRHALTVADCARSSFDGEPLWVCPMNEPAICASFNPGFSVFELVGIGLDMLQVMKDQLADVRCLTTDPIVGVGDEEYAATDMQVATGLVDVVGVNYYPHTARVRLSEVLTKTSGRYKLPVLLSETSWHNGHQEQFSAFPHIQHKADWFRHVLAEVRIAQMSGAEIVGICWYPATDMPSWDGDGGVWDNGLLRLNGRSVDRELADAMQAVVS